MGGFRPPCGAGGSRDALPTRSIGIPLIMLKNLLDWPKDRCSPLVIHGEAAFSGQGIVREQLNLSRLKDYEIGGTVHVILNNQIGFTTEPHQGRSTQYASDVAGPDFSCERRALGSGTSDDSSRYGASTNLAEGCCCRHVLFPPARPHRTGFSGFDAATSLSGHWQATSDP